MRQTRFLLAAAIAGLAACTSATSTPSDERTAPRRDGLVSAFAIDDSNISMGAIADVPAKRQAIIQYIWGTTSLPTNGPDGNLPMRNIPFSSVANCNFSNKGDPSPANPVPNLAQVDQFNFTFDNSTVPANQWHSFAYHLIPQNGNGKLVIVQQGHGQVCDYNINNTIKALVQNGYGVLAAVMPCWVPNVSSMCPGLPNADGGAHNQMFAANPPPVGHTEKYFFDAVVRSLNYLQSSSSPAYNEFDMVGLSGGGWTTTIAAAIDPRIKTSISVSGSKPMYMKQCLNVSAACLDVGGGVHYDGDREQMDPAFYSVAGFLDLYALAGAGAGRRHIQTQIRWDDTVFGQNQFLRDANGDERPAFGAASGLTWNQAVRAYEAKVQNFLRADTDQGWYRYEIDETLQTRPSAPACTNSAENLSCKTAHSITDSTRVGVILAELDGGRSPIAASDNVHIFATGLDETLRTSPPSWSFTPISSAVGQPAAVNVASVPTVFVRDQQSGITQLNGDNTVTARGGLFNSNPAATATSSQALSVAVGTDGFLWEWDASAQQEVYAADNQTVVGTPAIVSSSPTAIDVFGLTPSDGPQFPGAGQIHHLTFGEVGRVTRFQAFFTVRPVPLPVRILSAST